MLKKSQRKLLFLSSLGGVLEFYDFIIFALLASYLAKAFFPAENALVSLMETFATFAIGYLVRPLGGLVFGHIGDKRGRKQTFTASILLMAIATFAIAFVPTYQSIGVAAPLMLTLLRVIQGLSIGGEIPGAIAYVSESLPDKKGLGTSIVFAGLQLGIVLGLVAQGVMVTLLSPENMQSFGWRVPFFIGGCFGLLGYFLRQHLEETPSFRKIEHQIEAVPLLTVFKKESRNAVAAMFIVGMGATDITLLFLFTPSYISNILHITDARYVWLNASAVVLMAIINMMVGFLADRLPRIRMLRLITILTFLLSLPIFYIYVMHYASVKLALLLSSVLAGLSWGVIPSLISDLYPTKIRYSGIAVSYNVGFALFGGLTPFIASALIYATDSQMAPGLYLMAMAVLALMASYFLRPKS